MNLYEAIDNLYQQDKNKFIKLVELKSKIISDVSNIKPKSTLILGFNPIIYSKNMDINVLCKDDDEVEFIKNHTDLSHVIIETKETVRQKKFDMVLALDGYFTRVDTEEKQKQMIIDAYDITTNMLIVSVKDFKNMKNTEKMIDQPMVIGNDVFICQRIWDKIDKQIFDESIYHLRDGDIKSYLVERRRTLYFKQLAKYMHDMNCKEFNISKTHYYKNLFSRQYEYIAVIKK